MQDEKSFELSEIFEVTLPESVLAAHSHRNLIDFEVIRGVVHDSQTANALIEMLITDITFFIIDKAYDYEAIITILKQDHINPVISKRKNAKRLKLAFDQYLYKIRHFF